jgi:hypothetical protein
MTELIIAFLLGFAVVVGLVIHAVHRETAARKGKNWWPGS